MDHATLGFESLVIFRVRVRPAQQVLAFETYRESVDRGLDFDHRECSAPQFRLEMCAQRTRGRARSRAAACSLQSELVRVSALIDYLRGSQESRHRFKIVLQASRVRSRGSLRVILVYRYISLLCC